MNRSFSIKLKALIGEDIDIALTLAVSLPNTYPKSAPKLNLDFGAGVRSKSRREAEAVISRKPESLYVFPKPVKLSEHRYGQISLQQDLGSLKLWAPKSM